MPRRRIGNVTDEWLIAQQQGLIERLLSPTKSVTDRSRSVTYKDRRELIDGINDIGNLLDGRRGRRQRAMFYLPYDKFS